MIDRNHPLPITRQAKALGVARSTVYTLPRPVCERDLDLMQRIDRLHLQMPFAGARMLRDLFHQDGIKVGRKHIATLMKRMGIEALYRKPRTTKNILGTASTPTCYAAGLLTGPTKFMPWILPTSRWPRALSIWWRCWIGIQERCCRGESRLRWMYTFALRR